MKYDFGIILPSRNAGEQYTQCIKSIFDLAKNPDKIQLITVLDSDNIEYYSNTINSYLTGHDNIKLLIKPQHGDLTNYYQNDPLREYIDSKYIFSLSDNTELYIKYYDELLSQQIENFLIDKPDRILYTKYNDNCGCPNFVCWPITTNETFKTLDCFVPIEIQRSSADIRLYEIFLSLKNIGYNRILDLTNIYKILNKPDIFNSTENRDVSKIRHQFSKYRNTLTLEESNKYLFKLKEYIESFQK